MTGALMTMATGSASSGGGGGSLTVTISGPTFSSVGTISSHTFANNTATVTGGSGSYSYMWTAAPQDSFGTWDTGATTATYAPMVTHVYASNITFATYSCKVTDTMTKATGVSTSTQYSYLNFNTN